MQQVSEQKWTRDTAWRQGHVLTREAADALSLKHPDAASESCVVVVSHDCDIVQSKLHIEPSVEVIVGRLIPEAKGDYQWTKNPRTLHLDMLRNGASVFVELTATDKRSVRKEQLAAFVPDATFAFAEGSLSTLRNWLAVRYKRAAFPEAFDKCMSKRDLDDRLAEIMKRYGRVITTIYFEIDGGQSLDHGDGTPYELRIVLAYDSGEDAEQAGVDAKRAETEVARLFDERLFDRKTEKWRGIKFVGCRAIAEEMLTVGRARNLMQRRFEHLSLENPGDEPT